VIVDTLSCQWHTNCGDRMAATCCIALMTCGVWCRFAIPGTRNAVPRHLCRRDTPSPSQRTSHPTPTPTLTPRTRGASHDTASPTQRLHQPLPSPPPRCLPHFNSAGHRAGIAGDAAGTLLDNAPLSHRPPSPAACLPCRVPPPPHRSSAHAPRLP